MVKLLFNPKVTIWIVSLCSFGMAALIALSPGTGIIGEVMVLIALIAFISAQIHSNVGKITKGQ